MRKTNQGKFIFRIKRKLLLLASGIDCIACDSPNFDVETFRQKVSAVLGVQQSRLASVLNRVSEKPVTHTLLVDRSQQVAVDAFVLSASPSGQLRRDIVISQQSFDNAGGDAIEPSNITHREVQIDIEVSQLFRRHGHDWGYFGNLVLGTPSPDCPSANSKSFPCLLSRLTLNVDKVVKNVTRRLARLAEWQITRSWGLFLKSSISALRRTKLSLFSNGIIDVLNLSATATRYCVCGFLDAVLRTFFSTSIRVALGGAVFTNSNQAGSNHLNSAAGFTHHGRKRSRSVGGSGHSAIIPCEGRP